MIQIEIDEQGYIVGLSVGGPVSGGTGIEVSEDDFHCVDNDFMSCYQWIDGKAVLDEEKAAAMQEGWMHPPPTPEERLAALEALYLESILGGGL